MIVWAWRCARIGKLRVTDAAAAQVASPGCCAVTLQVPAPVRVSVDPDTVHTPAVPPLYATGRDDVAVAAGVGAGWSTAVSGSWGKVMVCACLAATVTGACAGTRSSVAAVVSTTVEARWPTADAVCVPVLPASSRSKVT